MTFCRAAVLVAVLVALLVTALLLRHDIADVLDCPRDRPVASETVAPATDKISEGIARGHLSDFTARFWDIVGEDR